MKRSLLIGLMVLFVVLPIVGADIAVSEEKIQSGADRLWLTSAEGGPGDTIMVDVMIENAVTKIDAVTMRFRYDTTKLQYVDWEDGTLNPGWVMFNLNESEPGLIVLGGFCIQTAIEPGSKGSLVRMSFKVKSDAAGGPSFVTVDTLLDDVKDFHSENGKIEFKKATLGK
ncbi:MAG: cohesin domain-containing protein [bacterium]